MTLGSKHYLGSGCGRSRSLRLLSCCLIILDSMAASLAVFAFLFHRHAEEVLPQASELEQLVEIIQQLPVGEPFVAEELAAVGVILCST